jgi:hypothetical protein
MKVHEYYKTVPVGHWPRAMRETAADELEAAIDAAIKAGAEALRLSYESAMELVCRAARRDPSVRWRGLRASTDPGPRDTHPHRLYPGGPLVYRGAFLELDNSLTFGECLPI